MLRRKKGHLQLSTGNNSYFESLKLELKSKNEGLGTEYLNALKQGIN